MAKKRSLKSYLMMAKYHSNSKQPTTDGGQKQKRERERSDSSQAPIDEVGQDNFGAQTSDERTTNESLQTANSIAGDSSSGYHSVVAGGGHTNGPGQFQTAKHQPSSRRQSSATERLAAKGMKQPHLIMVNERISGERSCDTQQHMWPAMIDDDDDGGANESGRPAPQQHIGVCNKVHLIDDDDDDGDDVDVDVDIDSYDIDCMAAAAASEDNNISERFRRHRYCVDANSSPASRFDESFQLERRRRQQQQQQQLQQATNSSAPQHHQAQQQYFQQPQTIPNYLQNLYHSSQFQPSLDHRQQQPTSLLNGAVGSSGAFSQQQQQHRRFVNHTKQADLFGYHQYPIPPTNYNQQQFHSLIQYQPILHQQHPYSYTTNNNNTNFTAVRAKPPPPPSSSDSPANFERQSSGDINHNSYSQHQQLPSLTPSGATKMQPASSRQYLTAAADSHHHHHHHHQQHPHKSSSRRQAPPSSGQTRKATHVSGPSSSSSGGKNKPSLDCCGKMARLLLFTTNLLFWSAGIALGAWGILSLVEDHKYNLSQLLVFEPNSRTSLFQLLSWSFITLGCATILVGFCGCSAIFKNNRWILGLYIFLVLAIFALDLATGLLAIIFQEKLVANVRLRLANKLRADYGVQASFTAAIDYIQTRFECCGLEGHFDYDQSVWRLQRLGGFEATVARTCCHLRNTFDDQAHINPRPVNESMCQSTDVRFHQSYRYRKGCLDDLERLIRHKIWTFTMGCAAVGGVILISLMFATCFCRSIQSYSSSRKESSCSGSNAVSSPKLLDGHQSNNSAGKQRHFTSSPGHQMSSSQARHHHHK